ncbi:FAD-binding oxidoreductase [Streptomyces sp. N2-109]|uniref:D-amino-acid oxidase n=1 Tax=Streptomyces gossypii TaxID=2883101 RepID=A0ABT2JUM5_9ACTN|nr:FAD-dependent oxidoreductase [Streptomyces gossypii]MCT2590994.1 FAD-binding oxidoreductase [Streptomyces gossypii]
MREQTDALVIGAGVVGLTTAVRLAEHGLAVRVRAERPPERTTSAVAGALVGGPLIADETEAAAKFSPVEVTVPWHRASLAEFSALAGKPGTGVRLAGGRLVNRRAEGSQEWAARLPGYRPCDSGESAGFPVAFWTSLPIVDMPAYLAYLAARCVAAGATMETGRVASLEDAAAEAPLVVNCAGVGARTLADDPSVFAVRGQHVVLENPGLEDFFFEQNPGPASTSFFPHGRRLVLGGTAERDTWGLEPDQGRAEEILRRCTAVEPRLAEARVLGVEVGLRASRPQTRLEAEQLGAARVIHNYGHGGIAVGLSWGCAREVLRLAVEGTAAETALAEPVS